MGALQLNGGTGSTSLSTGVTLMANESISLASGGGITAASSVHLTASSGISIASNLTTAGDLAMNADKTQHGEGAFTVGAGAIITSGSGATWGGMLVTAADVDLAGSAMLGVGILSLHATNSREVLLGDTWP